MAGRRLAAAIQVDSVVKRSHSVTTMVWHATLDARTIPQCRVAHGHSFNATTIPVIGYPGTVNQYCRCISVPGEQTPQNVTSVMGSLTNLS